MKISSKKFRLLAACTLGVTIPLFQFLCQRQHHLRLEKDGIIVKAVSSYRKTLGNSYVDFSFTTPLNETIHKSQKCGDKQTFDKLYSTMYVIYNPTNPKEFDTLYEFQNYSLSYSIMFLLVFYPIFLTIFVLLIFKVINGIFLFYVNNFKRNRLHTT